MSFDCRKFTQCILCIPYKASVLLLLFTQQFLQFRMILTRNITKLQLSAVSPDQVEGMCTKERNAVTYFWCTYLSQSIYVVSSVFKIKCFLCIYLHNSSYTFLFNKTNRRTDFPNLLCQETLHVSGSSSAHHQEFSTVHSALLYVTQV